jgi:hypothetical protein
MYFNRSARKILFKIGCILLVGFLLFMYKAYLHQLLFPAMPWLVGLALFLTIFIIGGAVAVLIILLINIGLEELFDLIDKEND